MAVIKLLPQRQFVALDWLSLAGCTSALPTSIIPISIIFIKLLFITMLFSVLCEPAWHPKDILGGVFVAVFVISDIRFVRQFGHCSIVLLDAINPEYFAAKLQLNYN
jgi:hypothetical protein